MRAFERGTEDWVRLLKRSLLLLIVLALGFIAFGYATAVSDPVIRRARISLADWPSGAPPVRAVLISDLHVVGPDMPPERLRRIVDRINRFAPDLVLIAGDTVSDRPLATRIYSTEEAVAPLAALRPRLGTIAVLGNHDHYRDEQASRRALRAMGISVLDNQAISIGPLAVGGLDDAFTDHADPEATVAQMRRLPGAKLMLSHSPDPFAKLPPDIGLTVAGHTHCGQIRLPLIGTLTTYSDHGDRYACGLVRENGRTLIVSAGLGASVVPLRIGAVPDMWLIELGPVRSAAAR